MSDRQDIDEIKARADIFKLLEDMGGRLATYSGSAWDEETPVFCPFCDDKNSKKPAGHANQIKGLFFCFNCGTGGDVIKLVQIWQSCDFDEALGYLDKKFPKAGERDNPWR